jgi:hypothetical protein
MNIIESIFHTITKLWYFIKYHTSSNYLQNE